MLDNISKSLVSSVTRVLQEKETGDKEVYQKFFNKALQKYGVNSPEDLSAEKKKEFFNYVDKNWKGDDESKNEKLEEADTCWDGYVQVGTKMKGGKEVPNCVPKEEVVKEKDEIDEKKMTAAAKRKAAKYRQKNKQSIQKYQKKYRRDIKKGTRKVNKQRSKSMRKSRAKSGFSEDAELDEKATSQQQQKLMGMAYALKKGEMDRDEASDEVKRLADTMSMSDLKDFASTKHDDLPTKIESTEIQESSDDDMKELAREIDDIDEIPNSIKQSLKNGELPSKRDVQTIDSEWAQDAFLVSMSEIMGVRNVEKMYGMKVIHPDAL